jgi:exodeoxyribonuclease-3
MHVRGWEKTSDHAPVWIELADKAKRRRRKPGS